MNKAVIVECKTPKSSNRMAEVKIMAESIGYDVKNCITQQRKTIHGSYCVGPGKLGEIKKYISNEDIDVLIFTRNLKGSQIFKIQEKLEDVNVIDRNLLNLTPNPLYFENSRTIPANQIASVIRRSWNWL